MRKIIALLALVVSLATACEEKFEDRSLLEKPELQRYLTANNITTTPTASGLYITPIDAAPESQPVLTDKYVKLRYSLWLTNGKRIAKSQELYHKVGVASYYGTRDIYSGLNEALLQMHKGEKLQVIIPSELAYGELETGSIPSYSTLVYEIEILSADLEGDETELINNYLDLHPGFTHESDTVYFLKTIEVEGNPDQAANADDDNPYPESNEYISVNYTGYFTTGNLFDKGTEFDVTIDATTQTVIDGFEKTCKMLKVGEKATVLIPSAFAYGEKGSGTIPPFTPIMFDIERVE